MQIQTIVNPRIYMGDNGDLLGKAKKFTIPKITHKFETLGSLGSLGDNKVWAGVEEITGSIEWSSFFADALPAQFNPFKTVELQLRGNHQTIENGDIVASEPAVVLVSCRFTETQPGEVEAKSPISAMSGAFMVEKMEITVGGRSILKIDIWNQVFEADGVDLLADFKANGGA